MRNGRHHQRALAELAAQLQGHAVEDPRSFPHLASAALLVQLRRRPTGIRAAADAGGQRVGGLHQLLHRHGEPARAPPGGQRNHQEAHAVVQQEHLGGQARAAARQRAGAAHVGPQIGALVRRAGFVPHRRRRWSVTAGSACVGNARRGRQRGEGRQGARCHPAVLALVALVEMHQAHGRIGQQMAAHQGRPHQEEEALGQGVGEPAQAHGETCTSNR